jgi:hypothetical protein
MNNLICDAVPHFMNFFLENGAKSPGKYWQTISRELSFSPWM